jgi:predicted enzyme related to lactoylglutathione lyase
MMAGHIVHLELHTPDLAQASAYYAELLRWRPEPVVTAAGSYLALGVAGEVGGGVVECPTPRPLWLPYVAVDCVDHATARATELGASVLVEPREGPAGWRSVVTSEAGGEIAFWQQKAPHPRPQSLRARSRPDGGPPWA